MKRSLSESDSDDLFDDQLKSGSPSQSGQPTTRKKRRGIIEKRRRDRINTSLSELRRLVPSAFEKQGSSKLEKAEILQMAVDHLKILHSKGINGYNYPDPHAFAMDYRSVGFRECAAEVARYLVAVEGIDLQDPMRLRLLSHLQCYSAQRETTSKAPFQNSSWESSPSHPPISSINPQYNSGSISSRSSMLPSHSSQSEHALSSHPGHSGLSFVAFTTEPGFNQLDNASSLPSHIRLQTTTNMSGSCHIPSMTKSSSNFMPSLTPQLHSQFPMSLNVNSVMSPNDSYSYGNPTNGVKHNRPLSGQIFF
ncbi:hypothetical protein CHS0354_001905 [Potamilus streckersoni]|uniref:Hairy/enhancer-of-split related with YRPW motif protein 1 n=1 Tax=Potamilus streckersoni TaxID=2493646 RepID=A0AAE0SC28_9BIVA|nr:hypothetical protein CHS0354_001905 [Potamilus streckersoni]